MTMVFPCAIVHTVAVELSTGLTEIDCSSLVIRGKPLVQTRLNALVPL